MCPDLEEECGTRIHHAKENSEIRIDRDRPISFEGWIEGVIAERWVMRILEEKIYHIVGNGFIFSPEFNKISLPFFSELYLHIKMKLWNTLQICSNLFFCGEWSIKISCFIISLHLRKLINKFLRIFCRDMYIFLLYGSDIPYRLTMYRDDIHYLLILRFLIETRKILPILGKAYHFGSHIVRVKNCTRIVAKYCTKSRNFQK